MDFQYSVLGTALIVLLSATVWFLLVVRKNRQ